MQSICLSFRGPYWALQSNHVLTQHLLDPLIKRWLYFLEVLLSSVYGLQMNALLRRHHVSNVNVIKRVNIALSFAVAVDVSVCVLSLWTLPLMILTADEPSSFLHIVRASGHDVHKALFEVIQWPSKWSDNSLKHVTVYHTLPQVIKGSFVWEESNLDLIWTTNVC